MASDNKQRSVTAFPPKTKGTRYVNLSFHMDHGLVWAAEHLPEAIVEALAKAAEGTTVEIHKHEYDGPAPTASGKTEALAESVSALVGVVGKLVEAQPASVKKRMQAE